MRDSTTDARGGAPNQKTAGSTRAAVPLFTSFIAAMGIIGVALSDWSFDVAGAIRNPAVWLIAAGFILTETFGIDLPFKSHRHTYSMSEIPVVLGLFYLRPDELIFACLVGSALAFAVIRRQELNKFSFNLALQFAMLVLQILIFESIAVSRASMEATVIAGVYAAMTASALLSHIAVDQVIVFVTGARSWVFFWRGLALTFATQLANASLGLIGVMLLDIDWTAFLILLMPIVVLFGAYHSLGRRITAEEKARLSEKRFLSLIKASSDVTTLVDADGNVQYVSDAAQDILGIEPRDAVGRSVYELFVASEADIDALAGAVREASVATDPVVLDITSTRPDGEELLLEIHLVNLLADEAVDAILVTMRDVTDRRRLEERLTEGQRMEAIGQLAGGIAHDFNNLLAVIKSYAEFVKEDLAGDSKAIDDVQEILNATDTASLLTRQLLSFARKGFVQSKVVDVNSLVEEVHQLLTRTIEESIELKISLSPSLPSVEIDPGRFEQVLMNLAVNAKEAMPNGGRLSIRTYESRTGSAMSSGIEEGHYVVVAVEDTGTGIDPDIQRRIFDPFFTTRPKGSSTGLGLSTAYGIVKQVGGHIEVDSRLGAGSIFQVYLPASTGSVSDEVEAARAEGPCTVLVAEDFEPLLHMVVRVLSDASYKVFAAESGSEAFELWQKHGDEIDLLVTDVVMPKMSGPELSELTRLPTLFMSGYTDEILSPDQLAGGGGFLSKPFSPSDLLASVAAVRAAGARD